MTFRNQILNLLPPDHPWGQNIVHLQSVDSTNTFAKTMAQQGAVSGMVVIADCQTGGRGRLGRNFSSPADLGLYFSLILRPDCPAADLMHLTCAVGVAATEAVETASGLRPGIKWTNDLVVGQRKLGGILTELSIDPATKKADYAVIGIGINCGQRPEDFPEDIRSIATSLNICGGKTDRAALAAALMCNLHKMSNSLLCKKGEILREFEKNCVTVGKQISICRGDEVSHATALGIDEEGALRVRYADGTPGIVASGEVSIRGMYGYL